MDAWNVVDVDELSLDGLEALFANDIAALRIAGFVELEQARRSVQAVVSHGFDYYENVEPPIGRIGITQYEHASDKARYLRRAPAAHAVREDIFSNTEDPLSVVMSALKAGWSSKPVVAAEGTSGLYFAGLIRLMTGGARIHCDWAPHDAPTWAIGEVTAQLAWNIYYGLSESGGQTTVYRRQWSPDLEPFVDRSAYGYIAEAVGGYPQQTIAPEQGDLVLFNSRNLHAVAPACGAGIRVSASSFIGRLPDETLVLWS